MLLKTEGGMAFCVFMVTIGIDCDTRGLSFARDGGPFHPELPQSHPCKVHHRRGAAVGPL
jgi:hypothetical protein